MSCRHKRLTESVYLVVVVVLVGLILHSQMNVYAAARLGSDDSTWSKLDQTHDPWNWSWLVAELHVEAAVWQQWLHTCVSQNKNGPLCTILNRGAPQKVKVLWAQRSHSVFSYQLIWMWIIQISLAKLVKWGKKISRTWQRLTHVLSSDPWPPMTRSCGCDPLAVSPHFCAASF